MPEMRQGLQLSDVVLWIGALAITGLLIALVVGFAQSWIVYALMQATYGWIVFVIDIITGAPRV